MSRITTEVIDGMSLRQAFHHPSYGACVCFDGTVRDLNHGRKVLRLEYEAYPALVLKEGIRIITEAKTKFPVSEIHCVHRTGMLEIGDVAIWIGVAAGHRREAFDACSYVLEQTKLRAPIWKREHYGNGILEWVSCH